MPSREQEIIEMFTDFLRDYYREEIGELALGYPKDQRSLYIDYDDLYTFNPDLAADLQDKPDKLFDLLEEALAQYDLPVDTDLSGAHVRVHNLPEHEVLDVADVSREHNLGTLIAARGQVKKTSAVKPRPVEAAWRCERCGTISEISQLGDSLRKPHECQGCERQGPFILDKDETKWIDHQFARVQDPPSKTKGGEGASLDVHLEDDLIQQIDAGDRIVLTGELDIEDPSQDQDLDFDTTVDTVAIEKEESDYEDIDVEEHLELIREIAAGEHGDPYELLIDSINPEHKGDRELKLAIGLQLFGGWSREGARRGDSHILMLGDPGCGKSTFLRAVDEIAPRSAFASGKGATAAGLTAAAVSDDFGSTEWGLEAGALVLADGGIACIDEIDKVPESAVSSMHTALEQQSVEVNKAGINATLSARSALLAAGNPKYGRFDDYQPIGEQIDLGPTLMSRFDLMFMVEDKPDRDEDSEVIDHMMRGRLAESKRAKGEELTEKEEETVEPAIPHETLRAYIAYGKDHVQPDLRDEEAKQLLKDEFLSIRLENEKQEDAPIPVTYRKEEAIERLAEASARVRLDDRVRKEDVERALELVKKSLDDVGMDPETGEYDADIIETGESKTQRDRKKSVKAAVKDLEKPTVEEISEALGGMDIDKVEHEVEKLAQQGQIYEPESGRYQTT